MCFAVCLALHRVPQSGAHARPFPAPFWRPIQEPAVVFMAAIRAPRLTRGRPRHAMPCSPQRLLAIAHVLARSQKQMPHNENPPSSTLGSGRIDCASRGASAPPRDGGAHAYRTLLEASQLDRLANGSATRSKDEGRSCGCARCCSHNRRHLRRAPPA